MTYSWLIGVLLTTICGCVSESKLLLHQQRKSLPLDCPVQILNKSELAGNYTVIDDQVTSNAAELHHLHSWAKIIYLPVSEKSKF